jgi:hypothetical protein
MVMTAERRAALRASLVELYNKTPCNPIMVRLLLLFGRLVGPKGRACG